MMHMRSKQDQKTIDDLLTISAAMLSILHYFDLMHFGDYLLNHKNTFHVLYNKMAMDIKGYNRIN